MSLKVIYHCYGGAHSSVTAAAIHLGDLPVDTVPSVESLMELSLFDRQTKHSHGQLHFFGFDSWGNQIYSVGCRNIGKAIEKTLTDVLRLLGEDNNVIFIDTLPAINIKMRIGGYLSRRWGLVQLGRPLVLSGTREAYGNIASLVEEVKDKFA